MVVCGQGGWVSWQASGVAVCCIVQSTERFGARAVVLEIPDMESVALQVLWHEWTSGELPLILARESCNDVPRCRSHSSLHARKSKERTEL